LDTQCVSGTHLICTLHRKQASEERSEPED
jgi:hypothetical protein